MLNRTDRLRSRKKMKTLIPYFAFKNRYTQMYSNLACSYGESTQGGGGGGE